jgi:hypothetical protein
LSAPGSETDLRGFCEEIAEHIQSLGSMVNWQALTLSDVLASLMDSKKTALERAFELAESGGAASIADLERTLVSEGIPPTS